MHNDQREVFQLISITDGNLIRVHGSYSSHENAVESLYLLAQINLDFAKNIRISQCLMPASFKCDDDTDDTDDNDEEDD